ncbi:MAG: hypothetical protein Q9184_007225 [Pyrenodesmia sp. 2 TL-2023]
MTTPSTTVLVDGVSDDPATSEATSVYSEDDPLTPMATQRHHLELLTGPQLRHEQPYPSADSFNASLDQFNRISQDKPQQISIGSTEHTTLLHLISSTATIVPPIPQSAIITPSNPSHPITPLPLHLNSPPLLIKPLTDSPPSHTQTQHPNPPLTTNLPPHRPSPQPTLHPLRQANVRITTATADNGSSAGCGAISSIRYPGT